MLAYYSIVEFQVAVNAICFVLVEYFHIGINLYKKAPFVRWSKRVGRKDMPQKTKKAADTSGLPVITCVCGAEILLVPNVKKMNEAIEAHVFEHTKKLKTLKKRRQKLNASAAFNH